jgi:hypothetical protein
MPPLTHARADQAREIYRLFMTYKSVFPHIRFDYVQRACAEHRCIYERGVVLIYQQYKRTVHLGDVVARRGEFILHQILSTQERGAAEVVFRQFWREIVLPHSLLLTVRDTNIVAQGFYRRMGMVPIGSIEWKERGIPLPGTVWLLAATNLTNAANVFSGTTVFVVDKDGRT